MTTLSEISSWTWGLVWTAFWAVLGAILALRDRGFASWVDFTSRAAVQFVVWRLIRVALAHWLTNGSALYWIAVIVGFVIAVAILLKVMGPISSGHTAAPKAVKSFVVTALGLGLLYAIDPPR
jgi:hypothetical protein